VARGFLGLGDAEMGERPAETREGGRMIETGEGIDQHDLRSPQPRPQYRKKTSTPAPVVMTTSGLCLRTMPNASTQLRSAPHIILNGAPSRACPSATWLTNAA
jgi:hypothetical protein